MKKQTLLVAGAVLLLVGCSADNTTESTTDSTSTPKQEAKEASLPVVELPTAEIGDGTVELLNASGSTEDGKTIIVYYEPDVISSDFDVIGANFNGELLSYIYVDGVEVAKEQLGFLSQVQIDVPDSILSEPGLHTVTVVQYPESDTTQEPVTVKIRQFEVKLK